MKNAGLQRLRQTLRALPVVAVAVSLALLAMLGVATAMGSFAVVLPWLGPGLGLVALLLFTFVDGEPSPNDVHGVNAAVFLRGMGLCLLAAIFGFLVVGGALWATSRSSYLIWISAGFFAGWLLGSVIGHKIRPLYEEDCRAEALEELRCMVLAYHFGSGEPLPDTLQQKISQLEADAGNLPVEVLNERVGDLVDAIEAHADALDVLEGEKQ